jgi:transcriptional regulator with XRE-family HTH domain
MEGIAMTQRRFPKKCSKCRHNMTLKTVPYSIQIDHDGKKYSVAIPELIVPACENCGAIVIDDEAERIITSAFHFTAHLLTPDQIREGLDQKGLSQNRLAELLGVSPSTVSRWVTGSQVQQRSFDRFMRAVFLDIPVDGIVDFLEWRARTEAGIVPEGSFRHPKLMATSALPTFISEIQPGQNQTGVTLNNAADSNSASVGN